eukprot:3152318-Rhodomonas_salina.1
MTVDLLRQLRGAEWEEDSAEPSEMGRHIDASRSLRTSRFEGKSEQYEIEPRGAKTSADEIAEHRRR